MTVTVERVVTSGTFSIDGEDFAVDNNIWIVGDDQEVLDSGPGGISWFTYFLLKGMEPGIINQRPSGSILFSELAAYVKVNSANAYHTPASGSMLGHEGGDYVLHNTSLSKPRLAALHAPWRSREQGRGRART